MELLILLLAAHFVGDFYLQKLSWVKCRNKNHYKSSGLFKHVLTHTVLYILVFIFSNVSFLQALLAVTVISITHLIVDLWKSYQKHNLTYFLIDQLIHIAIISIIWAYLSGYNIAQTKAFIVNLLTPNNLIIAMAYLLVCRPASIIIALALKKHTDNLIHENMNKDTDTNIGLVSAGAWIGYIERCLAVSFIFMGQFAGIGFLVATKTIFRFGDLTKSKDMKLTEYMMIGTLISYTIAILVGWSALQLYKLF